MDGGASLAHEALLYNGAYQKSPGWTEFNTFLLQHQYTINDLASLHRKLIALNVPILYKY
jgi:hypothetical protein